MLLSFWEREATSDFEIVSNITCELLVKKLGTKTKNSTKHQEMASFG
jgi:hypothetical protein